MQTWLQVVMITGDNPLTACHVSRELHFTKKSNTLVLTENNGEWLWENVENTMQLPLSVKNIESRNEIWKDNALCVTGEVRETSTQGLAFGSEFNVQTNNRSRVRTDLLQGLTYLKKKERELLRKLLPHIVIFARCAPKQKEFIIVSLQSLGYTTLMCGDGTNDVGALKHTQVGKLTKMRKRVSPRSLYEHAFHLSFD